MSYQKPIDIHFLRYYQLICCKSYYDFCENILYAQIKLYQQINLNLSTANCNNKYINFSISLLSCKMLRHKSCNLISLLILLICQLAHFLPHGLNSGERTVIEHRQMSSLHDASHIVIALWVWYSRAGEGWVGPVSGR